MIMRNSLLLFVLICHGIYSFAQSIEGKYDHIKQRFTPSNTDYQIDFFDHNLARIHKDGFVGLIDTTGKIILPLKYDAVLPFNGNVALIGLNGKFGFIDSTGKVMKEPFAREIKTFVKGVAVYEVYQASTLNDQGLINEKGDIITDAKYQFWSEFKEDRITFVCDSVFGIMTPTGQEISFKNDCTTRSNLIYPVNSQPALFTFQNGLTTIYKKTPKGFKVGCIDVNGKTVIAPTFDWIKPFQNGYAVALKNNQWGLIDKRGKTIISFNYSSLLFADTNRFIVTKNQKHGVIDSMENQLLPIQYSFLSYLFDDLLVINDSTKFGVIDITGKQVLPTEYEGITSIGNQGIATWFDGIDQLPTGIPRAIYHGKYFCFDKNGKTGEEVYAFSKLLEGNVHWNTPDSWEKTPSFLTPFFHYEHPYFNSEPFEKLFNNSDAIKLGKEADYDFFDTLQGGYAIVGIELNEPNNVNIHFFSGASPYRSKPKTFKKGIIDASGMVVVPIEYDEIRNYGKTLLIVQKMDSMGVIDLENNLIVPIDDHILKLFPSAIAVSKKVYTPYPYGQPGEMTYHWEHALLNLKGEIVFPFSREFEYDEIPVGMWMKRTSSSSYWIDRQGNRFIPFE